ncbi:hypothetical protein [Chroococcidiopsis sp. CCALA 051]|uniref:hypothetical protein n=1 Tax=Chroococcidiopsis sp. CCALA 051 TaxID=869949 RepID=UPI0011B25E00|nr:hypothetical protein [Chroococcidiopsis sp. CCALA 051]
MYSYFYSRDNLSAIARPKDSYQLSVISYQLSVTTHHAPRVTELRKAKLSLFVRKLNLTIGFVYSITFTLRCLILAER